MSDPSTTIAPETPNDAQAIERLHERTFGPGRFALTAYRLREHVDHRLDLSFTARIGTLLVGSVRQLPICIGDTPALLLGPLTVEPPFRKRGKARPCKCSGLITCPLPTSCRLTTPFMAPRAPSRKCAMWFISTGTK